MPKSGHKIFISFKFKDSNVYQLKSDIEEIWFPTTVRDYVNKIEKYFEMETDNIYKGERDNEDLSMFSRDEIWNKLKDRIFDSSVTIVLISPNMKENRAEKSQWIPWEISFSLKETTRNDRTSHSNALLAVVLPDRNNSYSYFMYDRNCSGTTCHCTHYETQKLFTILRENMFNAVNPIINFCENSSNIYYGDHSYFEIIDWNSFCYNPEFFIERAIQKQKKISEFIPSKEV